MPIWGWVCVSLVVVVVIVALPFVFFYFWVSRRNDRILREGRTVVARILMADPCLYDPDDYHSFAGAAAVFTFDNDNSPEHLDYLARICERLEDFEPGYDADSAERRMAYLISHQTTGRGGPIRIPDRITEGRKAFFTTLTISRYKLPKKKLTREYIYLKVLMKGNTRDCTMIEYPKAKYNKDS